MDEDECKSLNLEANGLVSDIDEAIENKDDYTAAEYIELKTLKKEAEAMEAFIGGVGGLASYFISKDDFYLANKRVGANVSYANKDNYCVDVIKVVIGDFVSYLADNNTLKTYTVSYKWNASGSYNSGNGTMGLPEKSVRHIYYNRDTPSQKSITVHSITCVEI